MSDASRRLSPTVVLCLAATWVIWGSTYLAIRFTLHGFAPFFGMGTRFVVAGGLVVAWMRWRGTPWPARRQWRNAAIIGTLLLVSGMGMTAYSELTVPSGLIVTFVAVLPALMSLFNLALGVRPSRLEVAGMIVGYIGVLLLTRGAAFSASPIGLAAICIACTSWSLGSVLSQRRFPLAPGAMGYGTEMLIGGVLLLVVSVVVGEPMHWPSDPGAVWSWAYLVVAGSLLAFNAYMYLLGNASAAVASSYAFVNPVIGLLLGIWLGHETVTAQEWVAAGVILAGVVLLLRGR